MSSWFSYLHLLATFSSMSKTLSFIFGLVAWSHNGVILHTTLVPMVIVERTAAFVAKLLVMPLGPLAVVMGRRVFVHRSLPAVDQTPLVATVRSLPVRRLAMSFKWKGMPLILAMPIGHPFKLALLPLVVCHLSSAIQGEHVEAGSCGCLSTSSVG
jgi:hypothetical protein